MTSRLFSPIRLAGLDLANRLVVSPMCQYSADDGSATDWHLGHQLGMANSGAGLFIIEATAVSALGRITHGCLGLYSDANEAALARSIASMRRYGNAKIGIQLGHAGRKASSKRPWEGKTMQDACDAADAWPAIAPSPIALAGGGHAVPREMSAADLAAVKAEFVAATRRADRLGLDLVELHAAHGYLLHQFLSPLSNTRTDAYGGTAARRSAFPIEVFEACRATWPASKPLGVRVSATDWIDGGLVVDDVIAFLTAIKTRGCDFVDVSTGGTDPRAKIPVGPGYQVPFAERIKRETGLATIAVGLITEPQQAEAILAEDKADMIAIARAVLDDPHWGWHAAYALGDELPKIPPQYARAAGAVWRPAQRYKTARG